MPNWKLGNINGKDRLDFGGIAHVKVEDIAHQKI